MKMSSFANPLFMAAWAEIYSPGKKLQPRLAYRSNLLHEYLISQNKKFNDLRDAIIRQYADKDETGELLVKDNQVHFQNEHLETVNKEFAELMSLDLEPGIPLKINLEDLEKDSIKLSGPDIELLKDLLEF